MQASLSEAYGASCLSFTSLDLIVLSSSTEPRPGKGVNGNTRLHQLCRPNDDLPAPMGCPLGFKNPCVLVPLLRMIGVQHLGRRTGLAERTPSQASAATSTARRDDWVLFFFDAAA